MIRGGPKAGGAKAERADEAKEVVPNSLQKLRELADSLRASMPVRHPAAHQLSVRVGTVDAEAICAGMHPAAT